MTKYQPLVSIVIDNYNYAHFLVRAIDSCLGQTYKNIEVLVVDDGSTDNSVKVIKNYGNKIIPVFKQNGGQASAFNLGFNISKGEIIFFVDADDYLYPQAVNKVVNAWQENTAKVHYSLDLINSLGEDIGTHPSNTMALARGNVLPILLKKGSYVTPVTTGNAFSRKVLEKILPIPEKDFRFCADGYLVSLVPFYGDIVALNESLACYYQHGNNYWSSAGKKINMEQINRKINHNLILEKYIEREADKLGYKLTKKIECLDFYYLIDCLVSLYINPKISPLSSKKKWEFWQKAFISTWQNSNFSSSEKLIWSLWLILISILPKPWKKNAIVWMLYSAERPQLIKQLFLLLRQAKAGKIFSVSRAKETTTVVDKVKERKKMLK